MANRETCASMCEKRLCDNRTCFAWSGQYCCDCLTARESCGVNRWPASPKIKRLTPLSCTPTRLTSPPLWPLNTGQGCTVCVFLHVYSCPCVCVCVLVQCWSDGETKRRRGDFNPQLSTPKVRPRGWKENLARPLCVLSVCVCRALASAQVLGSAIENEWV